MKLSIILAVNRLDDFLPHAINSILEQTYNDFEFIVIANNCDYLLWNYLKQEANKDSRIKIFRTKIGQLVFNLNYGLNIATGEYIARMDADDISLPTRLEKQVKYLDEHKDVNLCGTNITKIDENGEIIEESCVRVFTNESIRKALFYYNPVAHPSIMFRRCDMINRKGYLWSGWGEDYEYHLRCSRDQEYKFNILEDVLLKYRISSNQMTSNNGGVDNYANECSLMFREFLITKNIKYLLRIIRLNLFLRKIKRKLFK